MARNLHPTLWTKQCEGFSTTDSPSIVDHPAPKRDLNNFTYPSLDFVKFQVNQSLILISDREENMSFKSASNSFIFRAHTNKNMLPTKEKSSRYSCHSHVYVVIFFLNRQFNRIAGETNPLKQ